MIHLKRLTLKRIDEGEGEGEGKGEDEGEGDHEEKHFS